MRKLKGILLGWLYWMSARVHPRYGMYLLNRSSPFGKPVLDYLEFHLADHCNLNCAGCLHYAPFADKRFADVEMVRRDFVRLKELFSNIRHIRIMGGEPLLHPDVGVVAKIVREAFPRSKVRVVTNGVLLNDDADGKTSRLLSILKENDVGIDWTKYPPGAHREDEIKTLCADARVNLRITENNSFMARVRPNGGEGILRAFRWCRERMYCPILDDGRIFTCAPARYAGYYNKVAGAKIPVEKGMDIHKATAKEILYYLMCPTFACAYCDAGARYFPWKGNAKPEDWVR